MAKVMTPSAQKVRSTSGWPAAGPSLVLIAAAWFALLTGLLDAGIIYFKQIVLHQLVHRSSHVVWMAPVAYLALFAIPALIIYALARRWPRFMPPAFAIALLALGSTTSLLILLFYQRVHDVALVALAIGVAAQIGRTASTRLAAFKRLVARTTPVFAALIALGALAFSATRTFQEQRTIARLPAARAGSPNVLFIILDTVRAASLSLYGYGRPTTPHLERWAARGVIFDAAFAPSSWTLPSHASMFTGRPPHELSSHWLRPLDNTYATLAETFSERGYRTAGFVANLQYATEEMGLARGFERYRDYPMTPGQVLVNSALGRFIAGRRSLRTLVGSDEIVGRKKADAVSREFLEWSGTRADRPFFAFLNYYDAHDPYLPPDTFYTLIAGRPRADQLSPLRRLTVKQRKAGISQSDLMIEQNSYDGTIAYLDQELDRLFRSLEQRGILKNTLVIITSDHGEEFGEHGVFYHGNSLYLPSLHVPLVLWLPERVPGQVRVNQPVSLTDIAATITDVALREDSIMPGRSLTAFWSGQSVSEQPVRSELQRGIRLPDWYPVAQSDMVSLIWQDQHFIKAARGDELYQWRRDPWETSNLIAVPHFQNAVSFFRKSAAVK